MHSCTALPTQQKPMHKMATKADAQDDTQTLQQIGARN